MDLSTAASLWDALGEIVCLTFLKGMDESEALRRIGGYEDTIEHRTGEQLFDLMESFDAGYPRVAAAVGLGRWSVVVEPDGFCGADLPVLRAMSAGSEAISLLRHEYASNAFAYAVDGEIVTAFEPGTSCPTRLSATTSEAG